MSYEDLLQCATKLLKDHPQQLLQLKWIIIDEVQDCDELQFELIRQLKKTGSRAFCSGRSQSGDLQLAWKYVQYFL